MIKKLINKLRNDGLPFDGQTSLEFWAGIADDVANMIFWVLAIACMVKYLAV